MNKNVFRCNRVEGRNYGSNRQANHIISLDQELIAVGQFECSINGIVQNTNCSSAGDFVVLYIWLIDIGLIKWKRT